MRPTQRHPTQQTPQPHIRNTNKHTFTNRWTSVTTSIKKQVQTIKTSLRKLSAMSTKLDSVCHSVKLSQEKKLNYLSQFRSCLSLFCQVWGFLFNPAEDWRSTFFLLAITLLSRSSNGNHFEDVKFVIMLNNGNNDDDGYPIYYHQ